MADLLPVEVWCWAFLSMVGLLFYVLHGASDKIGKLEAECDRLKREVEKK